MNMIIYYGSELIVHYQMKRIWLEGPKCKNILLQKSTTQYTVIT